MSGVGTPAMPAYSRGYERYVVGLLFVVYALNFLDRQIVNILAEPIKNELGLADWQLGVLTGLAFVLFYATLGLPIARLAERGDRPLIIAVALAVWSCFTTISGFAQNFAQLLLARVGVGVGEAGCSPPAQSLICDMVPKERRATALSIFAAGVPFGSLLGLALGGLVADALGWRAAFVLVGLPGILVAIILKLTIRDPRKLAAPAAAQNRDIPDFRAALGQLRRNRTFCCTILGSSLASLVSVGHSAFYGSFYLRNHGPELGAMAARFGLEQIGFLGVALGLSYGIFGALGTFASGRIADRASRRSPSGYIGTIATGVIIGSPIYVAAMLVADAGWSLLLLGLAAFFNAFYLGPTSAVVQSVVHPRMRATASAVMFLVISLIGFGIGPILVGLLSDWLASAGGLGSAGGIRWSQTLSTAIVLPALALYWFAARSIGGDILDADTPTP